MKHIVGEEEIMLQDLLSFAKFADSAALSTKSELLQEEYKHDLVNPKAMTMSIAESIIWTSLLRATMSPGRDLFMRRSMQGLC